MEKRARKSFKIKSSFQQKPITKHETRPSKVPILDPSSHEFSQTDLHQNYLDYLRHKEPVNQLAADNANNNFSENKENSGATNHAFRAQRKVSSRQKHRPLIKDFIGWESRTSSILTLGHRRKLTLSRRGLGSDRFLFGGGSDDENLKKSKSCILETTANKKDKLSVVSGHDQRKKGNGGNNGAGEGFKTEKFRKLRSVNNRKLTQRVSAQTIIEQARHIRDKVLKEDDGSKTSLEIKKEIKAFYEDFEKSRKTSKNKAVEGKEGSSGLEGSGEIDKSVKMTHRQRQIKRIKKKLRKQVLGRGSEIAASYISSSLTERERRLNCSDFLKISSHKKVTTSGKSNPKKGNKTSVTPKSRFNSESSNTINPKKIQKGQKIDQKNCKNSKKPEQEKPISPKNNNNPRTNEVETRRLIRKKSRQTHQTHPNLPSRMTKDMVNTLLQKGLPTHREGVFVKNVKLEAMARKRKERLLESQVQDLIDSGNFKMEDITGQLIREMKRSLNESQKMAPGKRNYSRSGRRRSTGGQQSQESQSGPKQVIRTSESFTNSSKPFYPVSKLSKRNRGEIGPSQSLDCARKPESLKDWPGLANFCLNPTSSFQANQTDRSQNGAKKHKIGSRAVLKGRESHLDLENGKHKNGHFYHYSSKYRRRKQSENDLQCVKACSKALKMSLQSKKGPGSKNSKIHRKKKIRVKNPKNGLPEGISQQYKSLSRNRPHIKIKICKLNSTPWETPSQREISVETLIKTINSITSHEETKIPTEPSRARGGGYGRMKAHFGDRDRSSNFSKMILSHQEFKKLIDKKVISVSFAGHAGKKPLAASSFLHRFVSGGGKEQGRNGKEKVLGMPRRGYCVGAGQSRKSQSFQR